jgi:hypothetical protein
LEFCGEGPSNCFNGRCLFLHGGIGTALSGGRVDFSVMVESLFHEQDDELTPGGGSLVCDAAVCYQVLGHGSTEI